MSYCRDQHQIRDNSFKTFQNLYTSFFPSQPDSPIQIYTFNEKRSSSHLAFLRTLCTGLSPDFAVLLAGRSFASISAVPPLIHMPTLGFLKKKRTRESPGQKDLASPTSTSSQATSPITPTSSRDFDNSIASISTQSTAPRAQSVSQSEAPTKQESLTIVGEQPAMTQGVTHQQQAYSTYSQPSADHQNLPSINNLINPPQHDGSVHSKSSGQAPSSEPANGLTRQPTTNTQPAQHVPHTVPQPTQIRQTKGKYSLGDFEILRTLGTGSFGRVHLVQSKHNQRFYAVKVLKKQQVVKMKQVEHTNDERRMLQEVKHPFLITLWGTFQDSKNLYMVMDFVEGGELFSLLRKSQVWCGF